MTDSYAWEVEEFLKDKIKEYVNELDLALKEEDMEKINEYSIRVSNIFNHLIYEGSASNLLRVAELSFEEGSEEEEVREILRDHSKDLRDISQRVLDISKRMQTYLEEEVSDEKRDLVFKEGYKPPLVLIERSDQYSKEVKGEGISKSSFKKVFGKGALPGELKKKTEKSGMYG